MYVGKAIALYMQKVMPTIISPTGSGFVPLVTDLDLDLNNTRRTKHTRCDWNHIRLDL